MTIAQFMDGLMQCVEYPHSGLDNPRIAYPDTHNRYIYNPSPIAVTIQYAAVLPFSGHYS